MSFFDIVQLYNKQEYLNSNKTYFMQILLKMLDNKGIKYSFEEETDKLKKLKIDNSFSFEDVLNVEDINDKQFNELTKKQSKRQASFTEKMQINKHMFKFKVDMSILKSYMNNTDNIKKYTYLIDIKNINVNNKNFKAEYKKVLLLNSSLNGLGFDNIFDNNKLINETDFKTNVQTLYESNELFNNSNEIKQLFGLSKNTIDMTNNKRILGFLNTLLHKYNIKVSNKQKTINNKKENFYIIEHLNNIQEIIKYKIDKGSKIIDSLNIFKCDETNFIYKHLLNEKKQNTIIIDDDSVVVGKQTINNDNNCLDKNIIIIDFDEI